jgi:hypothetical protein
MSTSKTMQEIDTWTAAGWRDPNSFAHYVQAKMMMKEAMDAAHARGMVIRPVTNAILRLAQMPENLLEGRIAAAIPAANGPARKAAERSKQRDALALLVRRLVKRSMRVDAQESQDVDGNPLPPSAAQVAMYTNGALSSICMRKMLNTDILHEGQEEHIRNTRLGVADTWENAPYYMARARHGAAAAAQHDHDVGVTAHYIENLLLPGRQALRKDINAVMAFSATPDGRDFVPVGIFVYGNCVGKVESERHSPGSNDNLPEHKRRYESDYIHFVPKSNVDLEGIAQPEDPQLFAGNLPPPLNAAKAAANAANQLASLSHAVYYQQYQNAAVPANLHPSEMQHRLYDHRIAEIFVVCAQDPLDLEYQRLRAAALAALPGNANNAAKNAAIAALVRPNQHMGGWGSLLLAFGLSFIATERTSIEERGVKMWIPKYAGVVMELGPDPNLVDEAEQAGPAAGAAQRGKMATRGTQKLRNIARRMGFTSQPFIRTDVTANAGNLKIPVFAQTNVGNAWEKSRDDFVSLYTPGRDFFELTRIGESLPSQIKAENNSVLGRVLSDGAQAGVCPSTRGMGIVKCS